MGRKWRWHLLVSMKDDIWGNNILNILLVYFLSVWSASLFQLISSFLPSPTPPLTFISPLLLCLLYTQLLPFPWSIHSPTILLQVWKSTIFLLSCCLFSIQFSLFPTTVCIFCPHFHITFSHEPMGKLKWSSISVYSWKFKIWLQALSHLISLSAALTIFSCPGNFLFITK